MTKRKNLDLSPQCIKAITLEAVVSDTVFKLHAETILENYAKKLIDRKNNPKT